MEHRTQARKTAFLVIMLRQPSLVNIQFLRSRAYLWHYVCIIIFFVLFFFTLFCIIVSVLWMRLQMTESLTSCQLLDTRNIVFLLFLMFHSWAHKYKDRIPIYRMSAFHYNTGPLTEKEKTWIWVIEHIHIAEVCSDASYFPLA